MVQLMPNAGFDGEKEDVVKPSIYRHLSAMSQERGRRRNKGQSMRDLLAELSAHCGSDSLSEDGLREIIERHKCAPNNKDIQSYDFFHKACDNERVTDGIIRCLLEYFPDAASATDEDGETPLHLVCGNKNVTLEIVHLLIDAFPSSLHQKNSDGWMPIHHLCLNEIPDDTVEKCTVIKMGTRQFDEIRTVQRRFRV